MGTRNIDAANRREVERLRALEKKADRRKLDVLRQVCSTDVGREFVYGVIADCEVLTPIYDTSEAAFVRVARQQVGMEILGRINQVDEGLFPKMMLEAVARKQTAASERESVLIDTEQSKQDQE